MQQEYKNYLLLVWLQWSHQSLSAGWRGGSSLEERCLFTAPLLKAPLPWSTSGGEKLKTGCLLLPHRVSLTSLDVIVLLHIKDCVHMLHVCVSEIFFFQTKKEMWFLCAQNWRYATGFLTAHQLITCQLLYSLCLVHQQQLICISPQFCFSLTMEPEKKRRIWLTYRQKLLGPFHCCQPKLSKM